MRIEDHETLQQNTEWIFNSNDTLTQELEIHRGKVDVMTLELLRAFLHESYAHAYDYMSSSRLSDHNLNAATHLRPEISEAASKLRNAATRLTHAKH